jgi:Chaperone of endosialidase
MKSLIQLKKATPLFVIALLLVCFTVPLAPKAFGVVPAPDGGYPGGNTAEGQNALFSLTTGGFNTGVGFFALRANTTSQFNTAVGGGALLANTADRNTATGVGALLSNGTGHDNTATGVFALLSNTEGSDNTAIGGGALFANTTGVSNTAIGLNALHANTGTANTATGGGALSNNTTGGSNTAVGLNALFNNVGNSFNTVVGHDALRFSTGGNNIGIGEDAGAFVTQANDVIVIGSGGANVSNSCFIGHIRQHTTANNNAIPVLIDSAGQLGTTNSSRRFKRDIAPMNNASEVILALKPVAFRYKADNTKRLEFGLIAEEVADVNRDLVVRDKDGEIYTVRYDAINAMLLNEFLKEHKKVEQLQATVGELKSTLAQQQKAFQSNAAKQQKQIDALESGLQQMNALIHLQKPAAGAMAKY